MTEHFAEWFMNLFSGKGVGGEIIAFLASLLPIIECRGGMIIAKAFQVNFFKAFALCYLGNMLPMPFVLLLITKIFDLLKKTKTFKPLVEKLEARTLSKKDKLEKAEFWGLVLFVGIPLPGTGGWTGSLLAALLGIRFKKAFPAVILGILLAATIMSLVSYVIPWLVRMI